MRTRLHLKPGQKGTKQLLTQYGDRLVCVRYRYDAQRKKRFKTVELIIAEREWEPPPPRFAADTIVGVRVRPPQISYSNRNFKTVQPRQQPQDTQAKTCRPRHADQDIQAKTYRPRHIGQDT